MMAPNLSLDTLMAAIKAPSQLRLSRYMARVQAHLPTLANDDARRAFLAAEEEKWCQRYENWCLKMDTDTASPDDRELTPFDFLDTMSAVRKRKDDFAKVAA